MCSMLIYLVLLATTTTTAQDVTPGGFKSQRGRGTYMMAAVLDKKGIRSESAWVPGACEEVGSKHYNDLISIYRDWKFKPIWRRD